MKTPEATPIFNRRSAGILLHPTSLPGPCSSGDMGHSAYRFIELLHHCGIKVWQMLPLGPTHEDRSPYQSLSVHAGNPMLISLDWLVDHGWLNLADVELEPTDSQYRSRGLVKAKEGFDRLADKQWLTRLDSFRERHQEWLDDYALYVALKQKYHGQPWYEWPQKLAQRLPEAITECGEQLSEEVAQVIFEQFIFFTQWQEVREYATRHDVALFGDMPIFVAHDSADVWARRDNFLLNEQGEMSYTAGVPPDAFSDTGQRWGNPLYDWTYMSGDRFDWWKGRITTQLALFDLIRIDHFRGLEACWMIPATEETAMNGRWQKVPGEAMLNALFESFPHLPLVAEDLGVITDEVVQLKNKFHLPGMKVLQFAFDGNTSNPHLPHHCYCHDLLYTGTHDNDTTLGWINSEHGYNRDFFNAYAACDGMLPEEKAIALIRMAIASVSFLCVIPMQDLLMLDTEARMNTPGTVGDNWQWRFEWQQVRPELLETVKHYIYLYQR